MPPVQQYQMREALQMFLQSVLRQLILGADMMPVVLCD